VAGERLSRSEKRALLLWVVFGILGTAFAYKYFFRAFPEASVDFRVTRPEALKLAQNFVAGLGENVSGFQSAIVFNVDDDAKTYLERELGLQQANQLMSSQLHVWYWDVRFFRPLQEEEFYVRVSPAGNVVGYTHKIEEARPGATLDRATAQARAQNFLVSKLGLDRSEWDFLPEEANSTKRPNRTDWDFTWEKHGFRAKDAPYRLTVGLEGERIGGSQEYLRVPEAWQRSYQRLRAGNNTLASVFFVPYILLLGAAVWLALRLTTQGQTSWRGAIILGLLVAGLLFLQDLNDWPLWGASYNTNASYGGFILTKVGLALLFSVLTALTVTLVLPAAEPLYRASQPQRLQLAKVFTLRGLRSKEFFSAAVVGLSLAAAHIGYVVAFYIVAGHFGAWAPQEINYQDSVNTLFPWLAGAAIGLLASTNEEFTFRLFAIPFFKRLTGARWIAVVLPAFMWSFLHSNYPQEPPYIRGVEIGLFGIVAGLVMLRWGILATLVWHYTVDASLVGLLLVRSNSLYFKVSGIAVGLAAAAPLLFAAISYLSRGRFEPDEDLLNQAAPVPKITLTAAPEEVAAAVRTRRYDALSSGMLALLAVCLVAGVALAWKLKPESIGDYLKLSVNARSARMRGDEIIRQRGLEPKSYIHATVFVNVTDPVTNEFLRERVGVKRLNEILATQVPGGLWKVRYFRDSQPEEYAVILKPDGSLQGLRHILAEEAPGASLSKEEAVGRAEKFLRAEKKLDLSRWSLVEANSEKLPHRTDHTLTWQLNSPLDSTASSGTDRAEHAYQRTELMVRGDEVTDCDPRKPSSSPRLSCNYIKIPDEWRRRHEELTLVKIVFGFAVPLLVIVGFSVTALIVFLKNLRSEAARSIPWKRLLLWALWGLVGFALTLGFGDFVSSALNTYRTSDPFKLLIASTAISALLGLVFSFGFPALLFGVAWYYGTRAFGEERIPEWTGMPRAYYRDALFIGLGGTAACVGLDAISKWLYQHLPGTQEGAAAVFGSDLDAVFPAAAIVGSGMRGGLILTALVAITAAFIASMIKNRWLRAPVFVLAVLALGGFVANWHDPMDVAKKMVIGAVWIAAIDLAVRYLIRFNVLGYFLILAGLSFLAGAGEMLRHPDYFYQANGYGVVASLVLLFGWPLVAWRRAQEEKA
jgi:Type II CAAX prenyl endopeptidase Rce1-like